MQVFCFIIITIISICNTNYASHYVEYYQCNQSSYDYINYLTEIVNKVKVYYQKKYLAKRMTREQLAMILELIQDIYYYLKDLLMHNKTIRDIPQNIIDIMYKLICDITENNSDKSVFKVFYDFLYKIKKL